MALRRNRNIQSDRRIKHGMADTRIYKVWASMRGRCNNSNQANYGAKGIKVCEEWANSFEAFYEWSIANGYEDYYAYSKAEALSIDRIDPDGDYEPDNCQWITFSENSRRIDYATRSKANKNRSDLILIKYGDREMTLNAWAIELGIGYMTLRGRLKGGWSVEKAFETAPRAGAPKRSLNAGASNANAKLTADQVREMRALYDPNSKTHGLNQLADIYGITKKTAGRIIRRESWKDV